MRYLTLSVCSKNVMHGVILLAQTSNNMFYFKTLILGFYLIKVFIFFRLLFSNIRNTFNLGRLQQMPICGIYFLWDSYIFLTYFNAFSLLLFCPDAFFLINLIVSMMLYEIQLPSKKGVACK